jgi:ZIP family zinc transporter
VAGTVNLEAAGHSRRSIFLMWVGLVAASAAFAGLGYAIVIRLPGVDGHIAQAFAAGAMLTMLAEAMMPEAFEHGGKMAGPFTVLGFMMAATLSVLQ